MYLNERDGVLKYFHLKSDHVDLGDHVLKSKKNQLTIALKKKKLYLLE